MPGIFTLVGLAVLNHIAFAGARVALTLSALHVQASTLKVGMLLSMLAVLPMILSIPAGRWIDRIGPRWPMLAGTALLSAGVAIPAFRLQFATLEAAAVMIGLGFLPFHLAVQKLISQLGNPEQRRRNLSLMAIGFSISAFIGPILAGVLIDEIGHRVAFAVHAGLALVALIWMKTLGAALPDRRGAPYEPPRGLKITDLLVTREMRRLYLVVSLISSAWEVHSFVVPLYGARLGLSASAIGLVLGSFAIASLVVRVIVPVFLKNVREWTAILVALAMATSVYAIYPASGRLEAMMALSFILGLGLGVSQPMILSILAHSAPSDRLGEATGLRMTLVFGIQAGLPTAFGALGALFGIGMLFWGMAGLLGVGLVGIGRSVRSETSH